MDKKEYQKNYYKIYYQKHKEDYIKHNKQYYQTHKEQSKEYYKKYYQIDKDHIKRVMKRYFKTPNGKKNIMKGIKRWNKTPNGKKSKQKSNIIRRAKRINIIHNFSYDEWYKKVLSTNGICLKCKMNVGVDKLTMDHIKPISKVPNGFIYTINGVEPLCRKCNSSKNNKVVT